MKGTLIIFTAFALQTAAIWPVPSQYSTGKDVLWFDDGVEIKAPDSSDSYGSSGDASQTIIETAIKSTYDTILNKTFVPWRFHPRNSDFEPDASATKTLVKSVKLTQNSTDPKNIYNPRAGDIDESYTLSLTSDGDATITAATSIGLAHGLTTFTQLFFTHSAGGAYTNLAPVEISDSPKFSHRGLNIDVARSYYAPTDITRMIDALAYNKMNRLHIHATDSQSWPLEIPALPELARNGVYAKDLSYSPDTLKSIQEYGSSRGVEVYIEIDSPGHTSVIALAYPDLIAAFNVQPNWDDYAGEPPSGTLKLNLSDVGDFMEKLYDDLLPRLSPYTSYFHMGGDEINANAYTLDETVKSNDTSVLKPLLQQFVDRNHKQIRNAGLTPMVWEEILLQWNLTLGDDVVVQTWQGDDAVARTVQQGHKALAGNYDYWYLDCGLGQWLSFNPGQSSEANWPYLDYCNPRKNWRLMYSYDPLTGVPADSADLVLGGEVHMWSEQTDPVSLDRMVWPRACAAAEILWSGAKDASGQNRSQIEATPRIADMRERLVARGVMAEQVVMPFCTQNGTQCAL